MIFFLNLLLLIFFLFPKLHNERKVKVKAAQSCPTLCNPRIIQVRALEWVAFPFSRGASQPRYQTQVSPITGGFFTSWVTIPHTNSICNRKTSLFKCSITCDYNYKLFLNFYKSSISKGHFLCKCSLYFLIRNILYLETVELSEWL